jgi:hypothetical protein
MRHAEAPALYSYPAHGIQVAVPDGWIRADDPRIALGPDAFLHPRLATTPQALHGDGLITVRFITNPGAQSPWKHQFAARAGDLATRPLASTTVLGLPAVEQHLYYPSDQLVSQRAIVDLPDRYLLVIELLFSPTTPPQRRLDLERAFQFMLVNLCVLTDKEESDAAGRTPEVTPPRDGCGSAVREPSD